MTDDALTLVRHATLLVRYAGRSILFDPMLGPPGSIVSIPNSSNDRRNPLVPLPDVDLDPDAVVLTHDHRDHFDDAARAELDHDRPFFCQPADEEAVRAAGFEDVRPIAEVASWGDLELVRTGGQHGRGDLAEEMGPVSGVVLRAAGHPTLYVAGDTLWCEPVAEALETYTPDCVVLNAGAARFTYGDPITMDGADVARVCRHAPEASIVAVHLDAINHCLGTRDVLAAELEAEGVRDRVQIPADGETVLLN